MKSTHRHSPPDSRRLRQSLGNLPEPAGPARPLQLCAPRLGHCQRAQCLRSVPAHRTASRRKKGPGPQGQTRVQGGLAMPLLRARGRAHRGPGPPALPPGSPAGEPAARCAFAGCVPLGPAQEPRPAASRPPARPHPCPRSARHRHPSPGSCGAPLPAGVPGVEEEDGAAPGELRDPLPRARCPAVRQTTKPSAGWMSPDPRVPRLPLHLGAGVQTQDNWSVQPGPKPSGGGQVRGESRCGPTSGWAAPPPVGETLRPSRPRPPFLLLADTDCNLIFQSLGN